MGWRRRNDGPPGLVESARADITRGLRADWSVRESLEAARLDICRPLSRRLFTLCGLFYVGLTAAAVLGAVTRPVVLPALAPVEGESLSTLWQVQAALIGVALPLLFVLLPLVSNVELAAARTAELLMFDTLLNPVLVFGLWGVGWLGAASLWFDHDSAKWLGFVGVVVPSVFGVGFVYLRSARIIANPDYVRRRSKPLVLAVTDAALIERAATEYGNGDLGNLLAEYGIELGPWMDDAPDWVKLPASHGGTLIDVNGPCLRALLESLPRRTLRPDVADLGEGSSGERELAPVADEITPGGRWLPLCGGSIKGGSPVLALRASRYGALDVARLSERLSGCLEVEDDA